MEFPFNTEDFLNVFRAYNEAIFPLQEIFILVALYMVILLFRKNITKDKTISYLLAFFWLWMGVVYQIVFFSKINKAAYTFGALFILQAIIFYFYGMMPFKISFRFNKNYYNYIGLVFILYALFIYPLIAYLVGHPYPSSPTFGLPCPTTIFTFGILLFLNNKISVWVLIIPLLWSLIGFVAALNFSIYEDIGLLITGLSGFILIIKRNKEINGASA